MQVVDANAMFEEAKQLHAKGGLENWQRAEVMYNDILNHNVGNHLVLYLLATLFLDKGFCGAAIAMLERVVQDHPKFSEAWNNLGMAWQKIELRAQADHCFSKSIEASEAEFYGSAVHKDAICNRSAMHLTRGTPRLALEFAEQALKVDPTHLKSRWHKALALLELQRWSEAWEWHEERLKKEAADHNVAERNYAENGMTPWWDGESPGLIAIHGEQGLGDEIMFASCIPDMRGEGRRFVFEPSPRTHNMFRESFKKYDDIEVYGTNATDGREWIDKLGRPDFKIALGSLPKYCRRDEADFPGTPFLLPPPVAAAGWKKKLAKLGGKPKIGITWQGGVPTTAVHLRSLFPKELAPLFEEDCDFISLQYTPDAEADIKDSGLPIVHWPEAVDSRTPTGKDLSNMAALIANLDMVITVCQTAVHLAGGLGIPCLVLTPAMPSWRYGSPDHEGTKEMPWYNSVDLIRQEGEDWDGCVQEAHRRLKDFLKGKAHAA